MSLQVRALPQQHPPPLQAGCRLATGAAQPSLFLPWAATTRTLPPPDPAPPLPHAEATAVALVRLLLETMAWRRPPAQLSRWFSEQVLAELTVVLGIRRRARRPCELVLRSLRVQHPRPDVAEVSVRLGDPLGQRAWALRLENRGRRWLCTALELGPRAG